jgi:hypothetical protein
MTDDLAELYARDPQQLTRSDIEAIIADLRRARDEFRLGEKAPKKQTRKSTKQIDLDL